MRLAFVVLLALPFTVAARGDGCAANSRSPAPDLTGDWAITYDDQIGVEVAIGGARYEAEIPARGGTIAIVHDGRELTFELDCARPEVVCPSEAWPEEVSIEQRNAEFEHRMIVTLPTQSCDGQLRAPTGDECGPGTLNPDCDSVCDGDIRVGETERFGVIGESGDSFRLYLGAGIATNGLNCAMLGFSLADAELDTIGSSRDGDWEAVAMHDGLVTVGYAGGCIWAGNTELGPTGVPPDAPQSGSRQAARWGDPALEAILAGASLTFRTGFTGERL